MLKEQNGLAKLLWDDFVNGRLKQGEIKEKRHAYQENYLILTFFSRFLSLLFYTEVNICSMFLLNLVDKWQYCTKTKI